MASCHFCKIKPDEDLKTCVCKKVSYCSKECQVKDWKTHKPSCPPFIVRESPGKGRGLFATRKIKEGQIILEEYPLIVFEEGMSFSKFEYNYYPKLDDETKAKILDLQDPADYIKLLDSKTVEELASKDPLMKLYKDPRAGEVNKMHRIICVNIIVICGQKELYRNTAETGLYYHKSLMNHACVPNTARSYVMGDFHKHKVRAIKTIEKDEEIFASYWGSVPQFLFVTKASRQKQLLEKFAFRCDCSECSLEGEALEENEMLRAELMETLDDITKVPRFGGTERKYVKTIMKLVSRKVKLIQKLDLRTEFPEAMVCFHHLAVRGRELGIHSERDPEIYKQEGWKFANMCGDGHIYLYNKYINK